MAEGTGRAAGTSTSTTLPTSPAELERGIAERRVRLAATIDELSARARPGEIARRGLAGAAAKARGAVATPDGQMRTERIGAVAGATLVVVVALVWVRVRRR
jgi:hypothetical protein